MQEKEINTGEREGRTSMNVLGWDIEIGDEGVIDRNKRKIVVVAKPGEEGPAQMRGILTAAKETALTDVLQRQNSKDVLNLFEKDRSFVEVLLRLTGARLLREEEPEIVKNLNNELPDAKNSVSEFQNACAIFVATGDFPITTESVRREFEALPISKKSGVHLLDSFASNGVTIERKLDYFNRFLKPALDRLNSRDIDLKESSSDSFQPSTDDSPDKKEIDEADILQRVTPFFGGYYRERVYDAVDWSNLRVVASSVQSERVVGSNEPAEGVRENAKLYKFSGINGRDLDLGELTAPLPASAVVLPETISGDIILRHTVNGTYVVEKNNELATSENYEFKFIRSGNPPNWQRAEPTEYETSIPSSIVDTFSDETGEFLDNLRNSKINDSTRVQQIARRTQTEIEYVNDSSVQDELGRAGTNYFQKLEELKKGDCDVSGFYALAQIRALNIPCRMVTGYHIKKNKNFEFAAIAGDKHAWLEWYNKNSGLWERIDPTPPKKKSDEEKQEDEGDGGDTREMSAANGGILENLNESDDDPWGAPFTDEDMARLRQLIDESGGSNRSEDNTTRIFTEMYGVEPSRWNETRLLAERIGRMPIPRRATIDGRTDSTVSEQWRRIYELLLIAYRMPDKSRPLIGRQSQGGDLYDPVGAGIDIMTGSDDPYGFKKSIEKYRLYERPVRYSNDYLLDLTASMKAKNSEG